MALHLGYIQKLYKLLLVTDDLELIGQGLKTGSSTKD